MALKPCPECGNPTSDTAKGCAKCGAKIHRPSSPLPIIISALVAAAIFGPAIFSDKPPKTEAEIAQEKAASTRSNISRTAALDIRNMLRDPESLVFESFRVNEDGTLVCAEYRARNGFGGMNRERIVMTPEKSSQDAEFWNKHCVQRLYDTLWAVE